jgi:hypothetical protein
MATSQMFIWIKDNNTIVDLMVTKIIALFNRDKAINYYLKKMYMKTSENGKFKRIK